MSIAAAGLATALVSCTNQAPFDLSSVHPALSPLELVKASDPTASNVVSDIKEFGPGMLAAGIALPHGHGRTYVIGRFAMAARSVPDGSQYGIVLIDNRTHQVFDQVWPANAERSSLGAAWDYGMNKIGEHYKWLSPLVDKQVDGAYQDAGQAVMWAAGPAENFAFYGIVPPDSPPVTDLSSDLTIALVFLGPDRQPWGALRLN